MIDLWCVLDFERRGWGRDFVRAAAADAVWPAGLITEVALEEPDVFLMGRRRRDQPPVSHTHGQRTIVLGTLCEDVLERSWQSLKDDPPRGLYHLVSWDAVRRELRITSDVMGARKLYYAKHDGAWILSTTLGAFRHTPGGKPAPDPLAIAEILTICHPLGDRTLLQGVTHVPASRAVIFSPRGLAEEPRTDGWSRMPPAGNWSVSQSADALEQAFDRAVAGWTRGAGDINVAMTGGADSRLVLPFVCRHVRHVRASTFGDRRSLEVTVAKRVCDETGTVHHLCDLGATGTLSSDHLASFALQTEWLGDSVGPFYWRRWLAFLETQRLPVVTGYLGGIGTRLTAWGIPSEKLAWRADAARDDLIGQPFQEVKELAPFFRGSFRADIAEGVGARVASAYALLPGERAFERVRALDMSERQRRYTAWFPELYEKSVKTLHPFLSMDLLATFARMPLGLERLAVRAVLSRTLPSILRLPDSNSGRQIAHTGRLDFWRDAAMHNRYVTRVAERLGRRELAFRTFQRLIAAHRGPIVEELEQPNAVMADLIDMPAAAAAVNDARVSPRLQMRLYNLARFTRWFHA